MRYIFACILAILLWSCQSPHPIDERFRWNAVTPSADSLMLALDSGYAAGLPSDSLWTLANQLHEIAVDASPNTQIMARAHYWKSRLLNHMHSRNDALTHLKEALVLSDSARYPYDQARFRHLWVILCSDTRMQKYDALKRLADFYAARDDKLMLAHVSLDIAHILKEVGDLSHAFTYYALADSIFDQLHMAEYHMKTQLNNASILLNMGRKEESIFIFRRLLADSAAKRDSDFYNEVERSAGEALGDVHLLKRCLEGIHDNLGYENFRTSVVSSIALHYLDEGILDSARHYTSMALEGNWQMMGLEAKARLAKAAMLVFQRPDELDSMRKFTALYAECVDSLTALSLSEDIRGAESRSEIMRRDELALSLRRADRMVMWIVVMGLVLLAMGVVMLLWRRTQRHRLEVARAQLEKERESRKLVTASLSMAEKENALQSVLGHVGRMKRDGEGPTQQLQQIEQTIKMHLTDNVEMENLAALFEKVHPDFVRRLKERYPNVSEGDIKLAVYISVGMSTKQIAKMLLIQPGSVKMNRHRLRERLGLQPDESLEDLLRSLTSPQ